MSNEGLHHPYQITRKNTEIWRQREDKMLHKASVNTQNSLQYSPNERNPSSYNMRDLPTRKIPNQELPTSLHTKSFYKKSLRPKSLNPKGFIKKNFPTKILHIKILHLQTFYTRKDHTLRASVQELISLSYIGTYHPRYYKHNQCGIKGKFNYLTTNIKLPPKYN